MCLIYIYIGEYVYLLYVLFHNDCHAHTKDMYLYIYIYTYTYMTKDHRGKRLHLHMPSRGCVCIMPLRCMYVAVHAEYRVCPYHKLVNMCRL